MNKNPTTKILVTGATGGIGAPLCRHLSSKGFEIIIAARNQERVQKLVQEITLAGGKAHGVQLDFSDPKSFKNILPLIQEGLNGLVVMPPQLEPTPECLPEDAAWEAMFRQSFIGPVGLIRELIPFLKLSKKSKVVIVSGISSAQVLSHYATSNVLRTAWLAQAKTLAFAYGPQHIHFNTLSLGGVMTDEYISELQSDAINENTTFEKLVAQQVDNVPLRKYSTPEEVSIAIEGLLSAFSDHITGMNILCDGGFTRSY